MAYEKRRNNNRTNNKMEHKYSTEAATAPYNFIRTGFVTGCSSLFDSGKNFPDKTGTRKIATNKLETIAITKYLIFLKNRFLFSFKMLYELAGVSVIWTSIVCSVRGITNSGASEIFISLSPSFALAFTCKTIDTSLTEFKSNDVLKDAINEL